MRPAKHGRPSPAAGRRSAVAAAITLSGLEDALFPFVQVTGQYACDGHRVHLTGGNRSGLTGYRSNRSGPVPVWVVTKPGQIQNLNLNLKK